MEGQLPHPPILGIQLNCAFKCLKLNETSLMGLKIYRLATRYKVLLRPERSEDVPGSKVLSKDMRQKDAQPCCLPPHAIPAHHPVVLSLLFCLPKGPEWHSKDHHVALLRQWRWPAEPLRKCRPQLLCADIPPVQTLLRSSLGATCLWYTLCFMAWESCEHFQTIFQFKAD